jgi:hypothetical protein
MPGFAPLSGPTHNISSPPGPAAYIISSDNPNFICPGFKLFTKQHACLLVLLNYMQLLCPQNCFLTNSQHLKLIKQAYLLYGTHKLLLTFAYRSQISYNPS